MKKNNKNTQTSPFRKGSKGKEYGQGKLQAQIDTAFGEFKDVDTSTNLWAQAESKLSGLSTEFTNPYEDLKASTTAANWQKQGIQEQQANIMQQFKGAAGGSGVAGLAQSLSNQGAKGLGQISAGIAQQEQGIDLQKAQGEEFVQKAGYQAELAKGTMEMDAQKVRLQGAADARDLTLQAKQGELSFLSGMMQAANANEDADFRKGQNTWSDRRLKKNINLIGESPSGLNIYSFEYKDSKYGEGLFQGVMSDEIPQEAVINNGNYDMVNYNMLDVEFKQI